MLPCRCTHPFLCPGRVPGGCSVPLLRRAISFGSRLLVLRPHFLFPLAFTPTAGK
jgi:hypothetical protein